MAETTKAQNAGQTRKDGNVAAHYPNCLEAGTVFTVKARKEKVLEGQGNKETSTGHEKTQEPLEHLPSSFLPSFPLPLFYLALKGAEEKLGRTCSSQYRYASAHTERK